MQRGINGVNGASQNAQHAEPTAHHHSFPVIIAMRYRIHTSHETTSKTVTKIMMFVLSPKVLSNHLTKFLTFVHSLRSIPTISEEFFFFGFGERQTIDVRFYLILAVLVGISEIPHNHILLCSLQVERVDIGLNFLLSWTAHDLSGLVGVADDSSCRCNNKSEFLNVDSLCEEDIFIFYG